MLALVWSLLLAQYLQALVVCGSPMTPPSRPVPSGLVPGHPPAIVTLQATTLVLPRTITSTPTGSATTDAEDLPSTEEPENEKEKSSTKPEITASPNLNIDSDADALRFVQTTYWSCVTYVTTSHCGWHEPILDASTSSASSVGTRSMRAAAMAAGVALLLLLHAP